MPSTPNPEPNQAELTHEDRELRRVLRTWEVPAPNIDLQAKVLASYRQQTRPSWWKRMLTFTIPIPAVALAALLVITTTLVVQLPKLLTPPKAEKEIVTVIKPVEVPVIQEKIVERPVVVEKKVFVPRPVTREAAKPTPTPSVERAEPKLDVSPPTVASEGAGASKQVTRDFSVTDVQLRLTEPRLSINRRVETLGCADVQGSLVWIDVPGYGRFVCSLVARPGYVFQKLGSVSGTTLSISTTDVDLEIETSSPILEGSGRFTLWVLHQKTSLTDGSGCLSGSARTVAEALKAK
ncbi:MAG TPA: IMCp domain-containing protein [Acidobacteriota bacterium]|nr:IMCp domain-containing protein [Acidobacteriota bacterium]HND20867.1 IMCp domain-containing protein [Acidobacteriota bacterium]